MADIDITRAHSLDEAEAQERLDKLVTGFQNKRPDLVKEVKWSTDKKTAVATGKLFEGTFVVSAGDVKASVELKGFAAKMAKGMVTQMIGKMLDRHFPA